MASATEICNMALSHIGVAKEIQNLTTDRSQEASACRRFYETARDASLRDFAWPFATKTIAVGLVTDSDDDDHPTEEWDYSYRYPSDCLFLRKIQSGTRNDTRQTRVPYELASDDEGRLIYTDQQNAIVEYTLRQDDNTQYPPDFALALSFRIASYIAPRMTAGDPFKMGERALRLYEAEVDRARASSTNEEQQEENPESEFIRARE